MILTLEKLMQEDHYEFEGSLGLKMVFQARPVYRVTSFLRKKQKNKKQIIRGKT